MAGYEIDGLGGSFPYGSLPEITMSDLEELDKLLPSVCPDEVNLPQLIPDGTDRKILTPMQDQSEIEELKQTGITIETSPYPGKYKFDVQVEDGISKHYSFSHKFNRLYCNMDKAVPVNLKWVGPSTLYVRAVFMFVDPDNYNSPVYRCRSHNDETHPNNKDCKHYNHVIRCDSENSAYKKNKLSQRHSVITAFNIDENSDGVKGMYRFMCSTTCNGDNGIARRKTSLVLTLEDSSGAVCGRAVMGVKICSCPVRDKRREEEDDGRKKRKSKDNKSDSKKMFKREVNCTVANDVTGVKREADTETTGDYVNLQISIPTFPATKVGDFENVLKRIVSSYYAADEDIANVTGNVQIHKV